MKLRYLQLRFPYFYNTKNDKNHYKPLKAELHMQTAKH